MADAIGNVRATFTASAGGMIGAIDQIVGKLGSFAASAKRTQAQTTEYNKIIGDLGSQFLAGGISAEEYAERVGRVQGKFKGIGEAERMRLAIEALRLAQATGTRDADELASAEERLTASIRGATPPLERLSLGLAQNRADFLAGRVSIEQYRQTIATLPGQINGTETAAAKMERIFKQSQDTVRGLRAPTADLEDQLARLSEQFEAGYIDDQQYAAASAEVKAKLEAMTPEAVAAAQAAEQLSAAMERGKAVTEQFLSPQERFDANMVEMTDLLRQGAISQETFDRAAASAQDKLASEEKALRDATPEAKALAEAMEEGKRVTQSMLTPVEKYEQEISRLDDLLAKNAISEETHARATKRAKDEMDKASPAAKSVGDAFGGLPGPLGAAARAFDMMQKSLGGTIAGFRSGGISGGISNFVGQIRAGIANAGSSGGASLVAVAPQIALVATAAYAGYEALKRMTAAMGEVGERVERTGQLANRLGVSFQQYEILSTAAKMAGVETEALAAAQTKGLKAISAARDGAGAEAKAFEELGISQEMLNSTNPSALLEIAAQRLEAIEDPATRAALAIKIFGKSGNDVLPALKGIDSVRDGIARLGGVMNEGDQMRFTALDDAFDNASRATTRLGETLLAPFTGLFSTIAEGVAATFGGIASALAPLSPLIDGILKPVGYVVQLIGEGIGVLGRFIGATINGVYEIVDGVTEIVSYSQTLGPIFEAVGQIGTFIADTFFAIGKEIGEWIKWFEKLTGVEIMPMKAGSDADAVEAQIKAREDAEKAAEQARRKDEDRAKSIKEGLITPLEKYKQQLAEANDLYDKGLLPLNDYLGRVAQINGEFQKADPAIQAQLKAQEEQRKVAADLASQVEKAATAGLDLGAAAAPIRAAFDQTAAEIRNNFERGFIDADEAKSQMGQAVDAMNEELKRLGEDQKFAEKIRDGLKTEVQNVQDELDAIDKNQTLSADEKERAKAQVRDKFAVGLPGAQQKDAADKFREDQQKLKDALDAGLITPEQFRERQENIKKEMEDSVAEFRDKQQRNGGVDRRAVGAVDVNSSEGASTFFRLLRGQDEPTKKQLEELRKQTRLLERVAEAGSEVVQI